tara:strand:- start:180 stop:353 length:174 start_codon:yes stop_codon:yes gene_type:complete
MRSQCTWPPAPHSLWRLPVDKALVVRAAADTPFDPVIFKKKRKKKKEKEQSQIEINC